MKNTKFLTVFFFLSFTFLSSKATNYYSDPVSGSMSNPGTSASPWASLKSIFDVNKTFTAGDTIFLRTGNHGYAVVKGSNTNFVVITPEAGQSPTFTRIRVGNGVTAANYWKLHKLYVESEASGFPYSLIEIYAPSTHVTISNCTVKSSANTAAWTRDDWRTRCNDGISTRANLNAYHILEDNIIQNTNLGLQITSSNTIVRRNKVQYFTHDASRIMASNILFEKNQIMDLIKVMLYTENHDDLLQAYTTAGGGAGIDTLKNDTIRGNIFITTTDTTRAFRGYTQGIACFDGPLVNWSVENNIVMTDHWHGISLYGATNCRIVNNTVLDPYAKTFVDPYDNNSPNQGPAWISIDEKSSAIPSTNNYIANNLVANSVLLGSPSMATTSNNIIVGAISNYSNYFANVSDLGQLLNFDLHLKTGCSALEAGTAISGLSKDYDDIARPKGDAFDVGAYEYIYPEISASGTTGSGNYSTLKAAFDDINKGILTGSITLKVNVSTIETATALLKASGTTTDGGTSSYTSVKIYPAFSNLSIKGDIPSGSLIDLQGATHVTIDGRQYSGANPINNNKSLTIENSGNTAAIAVNLSSHAEYDVVKYCTIKGYSASALGVVNFQTPTTSGNGNSHNKICDNTITGNTSGKPYYGVISTGFSGYPSIADTISNNDFSQSFQEGVPSSALCLSGAFNNSWVISGNSIFDTSSSIVPSAASAYYPINILGGNGYTITDNYIGGQATQCGGSSLNKTNADNNIFAGIYIKTASSGAASSIQNNTIKNISWSNNGIGNWYGIWIDGGSVTDFNIGNTTGNTVGSDTGPGSINYTAATSGTGNLFGIYIGTSGATNCQNNKIGSITGSNSSTGLVYIYSLYKSGTAGATTISGNTIGSTSTANSINSTSAVASQNVFGIYCAGTSASNAISNNTIANLANSTTTGAIYGIYLSGVGTTTLNANLIHTLSMSSNLTTGLITGILLGSSVSSTCSNNIILLGGNNPATIYGFNESASAKANNLYHNTVYIDGAPTSKSLKSYCLYSAGTGSTNARNFLNNILYNNRVNAGATGNNYAIGLATYGSGTLVSNYNDLYVANATNNYVSIYNTSNKKTLANWQTTLINGGYLDLNSLNINPSFASAGGKLASNYIPSAGSLAAGATGTGITVDYGVGTRSSTVPSIGAFELGSTYNKVVRRQQPEMPTTVTFTKTGVEANFSEPSIVEIYSIRGELIERTSLVKTYSRTLLQGIYILRINGKATKFKI